VYRNALAKLLQEYYGAKLVTKDNILGTAGVSGAIFSTHLMLKTEKAPNAVRIGLVSPFYTYHLRQANRLIITVTNVLQIMELHGKPPVFIATNDDLTPNWDNIETALKGGLDLLMFCNPGNPQGNVWPKEDVDKIVKLTADYKCLLLIDEIYNDLVWKGNFYSPINEKIYEHVIVCRGFSKSLGAQSWRLAYMISHPSIISKVMRVHDPVYIRWEL
jgi:aspartate/methionine/tyrosine aminotransferase